MKLSYASSSGMRVISFDSFRALQVRIPYYRQGERASQEVRSQNQVQVRPQSLSLGAEVYMNLKSSHVKENAVLFAKATNYQKVSLHFISRSVIID